MSKISLSAQLSAHRKKREALEQLIQFARQVCVAGDGMEALQFVLRPSQTTDKTGFTFLQKMQEHLLPLETKELKKRLKSLDQALVAEVQSFLQIASLSEADFVHLYASDDNLDEGIDALSARMDAFRRKTQTDVAIRLILIERGVQLQALKLGVTQEDLAEQMLQVHQKELRCRKKIKQRVEELLQETRLLLAMPEYPDAMKDHMRIVESQLKEALAHVNAGRRLEDLPYNIEIHEEVYELPVGYEAAVEAEQNTSELVEDGDDGCDEQDVPLPGFFQTLQYWLNSPAGVSWRDIREGRYPPH